MASKSTIINPTSLVVEKGCLPYGVHKRDSLTVERVERIEGGGARLVLRRRYDGKAFVFFTAAAGKLARDSFNLNKGNPLRFIKVRVVAREER